MTGTRSEELAWAGGWLTSSGTFYTRPKKGGGKYPALLITGEGSDEGVRRFLRAVRISAGAIKPKSKRLGWKVGIAGKRLHTVMRMLEPWITEERWGDYEDVIRQSQKG